MSLPFAHSGYRIGHGSYGRPSPLRPPEVLTDPRDRRDAGMASQLMLISASGHPRSTHSSSPRLHPPLCCAQLRPRSSVFCTSPCRMFAWPEVAWGSRHTSLAQCHASTGRALLLARRTWDEGQQAVRGTQGVGGCRSPAFNAATYSIQCNSIFNSIQCSNIAHGHYRRPPATQRTSAAAAAASAACHPTARRRAAARLLVARPPVRHLAGPAA